MELLVEENSCDLSVPKGRNVNFAKKIAALLMIAYPVLTLASTAESRHQCATSDLFVESLSAGIAAGTAGINYILHNRGTVSCTLSGFPVLSALDAHGKIIKAVKFKRMQGIWGVMDAESPSSVEVAPGSKAWFQIVYSDGNGLEDRSSCHTITGLRIQLPGNKEPLVDHTAFAACSSVNITSIRPPPYGN